jgi:hypothetical protein
VRRPNGRILERTSGNGERGLPRANRGFSTGFGADGTRRGCLLLLRLAERCQRVTMRNLRLVELLLRNVAALRERGQSLDRACGKRAVRMRAPNLVACDRRVGFLGLKAPADGVELGFRPGPGSAAVWATASSCGNGSI